MIDQLRIGVVGVGTMGAQVLWQLSRRPGVLATGFETYAPGHSRGAAGGETRLFRTLELEDVRYGPIVDRADALWPELERRTRRTLRTRTGALVLGSPDSPSTQVALRDAARDPAGYVVYDEDQLRRRHPEFTVDPGDIAIWDPRGGIIRPELTVAATARLAEANGARIHRGTRVREVGEASGRVVVRTDDGRHHFDRVVVATGGWTSTLLPGFDQVETRRLISSWHFATTPEYLARIVPFIRTEPRYCYGMPTADRTAFKFGLGYRHHRAVRDPDAVERVVQPAELAPFSERIRRYLPGLDPEPMRTETYLETYTATRREWLGPHPELADVVVLSGFSGHGFKLCPAIGEIGAQLAVGERPALDLSFLERGQVA